MLLVRLREVTGRPPSGSAVANALPTLLAEVLGRVPVVSGREPPPPPPNEVPVPGRDITLRLQAVDKSSWRQHSAG